MKYVFAGDRDIAVSVLNFIIDQGTYPEALLVSDETRATHSQDLIKLSGLPAEKVFVGKEFGEKTGLDLLRNINPDYIIGIHFPYIISKEVLDIPKIGFLNLHPAYLPFNRGWHTPSWAILDNTPVGGTLHLMAEKLDAGDIVHRKEVIPEPYDTANSLYSKLKSIELDVFKEAWPQIKALSPNRIPQKLNQGTAHKRNDLFMPEVQELDLDKSYKLDDLLKRLRGLTTNDIREAGYFHKNGKKYRIQIHIEEDKG